jgi:hypothetical protein
MNIDELLPMLRAHLLGCDTLSADDAINTISALLDRMRLHSSEPFTWPLFGAHAARFEKLYFDGPAERDWRALAFVGDRPCIVFDEQHIAVPSNASVESGRLARRLARSAR